MTKLKLLYLLAFMSLTATVFGQNIDKRIHQNKVPKQITDYLHKNYYKNLKAKFYQERKSGVKTIEVDFSFQNRKYTLSFTDQGDFLEEEIELDFKSLPDNIQKKIESYLTEKYPSFKIIKCQEVSPNTERSIFEIEVRHSGNYYEIYFDNTGNFKKYEELIFKPINTQF